MKLTYQAFDRSGRALRDTIEARDIAEANDLLRRQELYVTAISAPDGGSVPKTSTGGSVWRQGKRLKNLAMFTRQLHVLVSTGTPLVEALAALERQAKEPAWRGVVTGVRSKVEEGASLSG